MNHESNPTVTSITFALRTFARQTASNKRTLSFSMKDLDLRSHSISLLQVLHFSFWEPLALNSGPGTTCSSKGSVRCSRILQVNIKPPSTQVTDRNTLNISKPSAKHRELLWFCCNCCKAGCQILALIFVRSRTAKAVSTCLLTVWCRCSKPWISWTWLFRQWSRAKSYFKTLQYIYNA